MAMQIGDSDMVGRECERAREDFRPEHIEWLLVIEARPRSLDRFFYFTGSSENDGLFLETTRAVLGNDDLRVKNLRYRKEEHLEKLRSAGFYLIEAVETPVNRSMPIGKRKARVLESMPSLIARIRGLDAEGCKVILVGSPVYQLRHHLRREGITVQNDCMIPFPSSGHQKEFREQLRRMLGTNLKSEACPRADTKVSVQCSGEARSCFVGVLAEPLPDL
ncbi:MAG TPA: hypothetical protein VMB46_06845 [Methanomassiliicoccales archaeon]|nr:hypothetical protein [Methanomassiliicoccales archaeon]